MYIFAASDLQNINLALELQKLFNVPSQIYLSLRFSSLDPEATGSH